MKYTLSLILCTSLYLPCFAQTAHYRTDESVLLNDSDVTPGKVRTTDKQIICGTSTKKFRDTTQKMKKQVCLSYGLKPHCYGRTTNEIDHLISLELGGADETDTLWPQPYNKHPGAHEKDSLENELHRMVCEDKMEITDAQTCIASDWWKCSTRLEMPYTIKKTEHDFMDRPAYAALAATATLSAFDAGQTCHNLATGGHETFLPTQRCGPAVAMLAVQPVGLWLLANAAHKSGHHKIERMLEWTMPVVSTRSIIYSQQHGAW